MLALLITVLISLSSFHGSEFVVVHAPTIQDVQSGNPTGMSTQDVQSGNPTG